MALDTFIAGRYSATYNANDVGITRDGYELQFDMEMEDIGETDAYGLSVIDGVWRGGNVHCQLTSTAYKTGSLAAFWPIGGAVNADGVFGILVDGGVADPNKLPIGELASNMAKAFVLTVTVGTPADGNPDTVTASKALLAKNNGGKLLFNSKLRDVPVRLRFYPYEVSSGLVKFFVTT